MVGLVHWANVGVSGGSGRGCVGVVEWGNVG